MISNNIDKFQQLFDRVSSIIEEAKHKIEYSINSTMVQSYWRIGKEIIEEEQKGQFRAEYGKSIVKNLSERLTKQYGMNFDSRNLRFMRQFYKVYPNWNAVSSKLSWTHYRFLIRIDDPMKRSFSDDNPPIGIILCADKSEAIVKYTLPEGNKHIFASRYKLYLPTEEELRTEILREKAILKIEANINGEEDAK